MAIEILERVARPKLSMKKIGLAMVLLITILSGCSSVVSNSEKFYQDRPRRPINWREYMTD